MRELLRKTSGYFILFMVVSFLGWVAETIFFLFRYGGFYDRGFMTLPFCTIYGFSFLLVYGSIGTPEAGGILRRRPGGGRRSSLAYFLLAALIPTGLELLTGLFFHRVFGIRLWSYASYRFHFQGYICLEYALLWGALIPLCMRYIFAPMKKKIFSITPRYARLFSGTLAVLAIMDWAVNFSQQDLMIG